MRITFTGIQDLKLSNLHPGTKRQLEIISVIPDQLEGLRYRVFNIEQDFGLSFYCADFKVTKVRHSS